jgi:acyl CoA:acetate/3-ketoacid CoA transferase beta subunit
MTVRAGREISLWALDFPRLLPAAPFLVWGQAMAEPLALTGQLMKQRSKVGKMRAFVGIGWSHTASLAHTDHVEFSSYCAAGNNRSLGDKLDIYPMHYSSLAATLARERPVLFLQLAPGPDDAHFYLGAAAEYLLDLIPDALLVIGEVNSAAPRAGPLLRRNAVDFFVRVDSELATAAAAKHSDTDRQVAYRAAGLIEDGATLQVGIGGIPAATLGMLRDRRDLGVHSGLIGDEIVDLVNCGAITNARKGIDRGVTVSGLLAGTHRLAKWADNNPALALRPTSYTHSHAVLARIDGFVAVNSAIEVDLTGQVNAEVAERRYVGAVGGAVDFVRGARAARGGLPIIALNSTKGGVSRIVAKLSGPVSTSRADSVVVVTEYGVADLRDLPIQARIRHMIAIAHPEHQQALAEGIGKIDLS